MIANKPFQVLLTVALLSGSYGVVAQDKPNSDIPVHTGKGKVTEAVNTKNGAVFDIGGGITITLPRGLPIGQSRVLTLKKTNRPPKPAQIHKKFRRHGQTVVFTGALNAPDSPIVLAMKMKKKPEKRGQKLVLAMEETGLCTDENKRYKLGKGLCSVWRIIETEYDLAGKRIIAKLSSTGGLRLQFGWIPDTE